MHVSVLMTYFSFLSMLLQLSGISRGYCCLPGVLCLMKFTFFSFFSDMYYHMLLTKRKFNIIMPCLISTVIRSRYTNSFVVYRPPPPPKDVRLFLSFLSFPFPFLFLFLFLFFVQCTALSCCCSCFFKGYISLPPPPPRGIDARR